MEPDEVLVVSSTGRATSLNSLSDGYLTTLGWTIDLIARWADRYRDTGKLDENFAKDMPGGDEPTCTAPGSSTSPAARTTR
ncbi:MAG: hypothetical protein IPH80_37435 [Myxococcales bacterium]|nr:hypothetical protein [Myxococcales bacterium]